MNFAYRNRHYMNVETGELVFEHGKALEWFKEGYNVDILQLVDGEWQRLGRWTH